MSHKTRTLEELISLQDQAIEALKQALAATQLALECLQKNRNEKGFAIPMDFPVQPNPLAPYNQPVTLPFLSPTTVPNQQPQWGGTAVPHWGQTWGSNEVFSGKLVGMTSLVPTGQCETATLDSQYANTEQTLQNAQTVSSLAVAYLNTLQKESDEYLHSSGTAHQGGIQCS